MRILSKIIIPNSRGKAIEVCFFVFFFVEKSTGSSTDAVRVLYIELFPFIVSNMFRLRL